VTEHGRYRYTHYKCRCDICRKANADYCRKRREIRSTQDITAPHGKRTTYTNYGCRCGECTEAHRIYQSQYIARKKDQSYA